MVIPRSHRLASFDRKFLEGEGLMTIDGKEVIVRKGDTILNPAGGHHGLVNNSDEDIDPLVIQVGIKT